MISLNRSVLARTIILSSILIPLVASSQVKIKERVEIKPRLQGKGPITLTSESWPGPGSLAFQRGGVLTIGLSFPDHTVPVVMNGIPLQEGVEDPPIPWGTFTQWSGSTFDLRAADPAHPLTYVPHPQSSSVIGGGIDYGFLIYARPESPDIIDVAYWVRLQPDSTEAMPPRWYLDYEYGPGDPFDKTRAAVVQLPFECTYRIVVSQAKPTATDDVLMTLPETRLLWSNVATHVGDTIVVGPYPRGTQIQLALVSGIRTLVKGDTLYPQAADLGNSLEFHFEDWTDETFNDVVIRVEPNAGTPDHLEIAADTDPIWYGDTTYIAIKPTDISGNLSPLGFDSGFEFSIELLPESEQYGTLLYNGDSGTYFDHVPSVGGKGVGVQFAANGLEPDSTISLRFHLREYYSGGIIPTRAGKYAHAQEKLTKGAATPKKELPHILTMRGLASVAAVDKKLAKINDVVDHLENDETYNEDIRQILLGETKYYYARKGQLGSLVIEETTDPDAGKGISSVIMEDPVIAADAVNNDKVGVYWDYYKPDGTDLDNGVIRLIGRYWRQDTTYKVKMLAVLPSDEKSASAEIKVKKPKVLGNKDLTPQQRYSVVKDVFNNDLNLDELIIKHAGANGIPPQLIKGQMEKESSFKPQWRYEPIVDFAYQMSEEKNARFFPTGSPYVKSNDHSKGTGDWPYDVQRPHSNVFPAPYDSSTKTIGSYLADNWSKNRRIGKLGEPDSILNSTDLTKRFKELYKPPTKLNDESDWKAKRLAYDSLGKELKEAHTRLAKKYGLIAQTRIVSSYGFAQILYTMTIDYGGIYNYETDGRYFPTDTPYMAKLDSHRFPEMLNEEDTFIPIYCDRMLRNLNLLFPSRITSSQWSTTKLGARRGYEANWEASLHFYNKKDGYKEDVMLRSIKYLPH